MINLIDLTKSFGPLVAVDGISLTIERGEVLGFLGPNGAGKTTTMRMIAGFLQPTSGSATVCGFDVVHDALEAKARLGYLPEGAPLYGDMTCRSFLSFVARLRGYSGRDIERHVDGAVEKMSLGSVLRQPIDTLSKGFKRRVGLAQAILHDPEILILDEPTDGLDPNQKHQVRDLIKDMAANKAIIVSTHILEEVEAVCTRAVIIARGKVVADGTADQLLDSMPYHKSVVVSVPVAERQKATAALSSLAPLAEQESETGNAGVAVLRVPAQAGVDHGAGFIADVAHKLKAADVTVEALFVHRERLDNVFRRLTVDGYAADGAPPAGENGEGGSNG
jgi:ABC-2 type transport system ATP-binding protein